MPMSYRTREGQQRRDAVMQDRNKASKQAHERQKDKILDGMKERLEPKVWEDLREAGAIPRKRFF